MQFLHLESFLIQRLYGSNPDPQLESELVYSYVTLGVLYRDADRFQDAEKSYKKALEAIQGNSLEENLKSFSILHNLADAYIYQGKLLDAQKTYEFLLAHLDPNRGGFSTLYCASRKGLADVYVSQGMLEEDKTNYKMALWGYHDLLLQDITDKAAFIGLVEAPASLGSILEISDGTNEAGAMYERVGHQLAANGLQLMSLEVAHRSNFYRHQCEHGQDQKEDAEKWYGFALTHYLDEIPPEHPSISSLLHDWGCL